MFTKLAIQPYILCLLKCPLGGKDSGPINSDLWKVHCYKKFANLLIITKGPCQLQHDLQACLETFGHVL